MILAEIPSTGGNRCNQPGAAFMFKKVDLADDCGGCRSACKRVKLCYDLPQKTANASGVDVSELRIEGHVSSEGPSGSPPEQA